MPNNLLKLQHLNEKIKNLYQKFSATQNINELELISEKISTLRDEQKSLQERIYTKVKEPAEEQNKTNISHSPNKVGRPAIGKTRKVSITLPARTWKLFEEEAKVHGGKSAFLRYLFETELENYIPNKK